MAGLFPTLTRPLVISNVRVFDGEKVFERRTVLVEHGKISCIEETTNLPFSHATVHDGNGCTLLPGLIDAHVHVPANNPEPALRQCASFGVTTVLDMMGGGAKLQVRQQMAAFDPADQADLRVAGYGAIAPESALVQRANARGKPPLPTISGPEQAHAWVEACLAEGSDYLKIVFDEQRGGRLSQETVKAIVQAAHQRNTLVVAHALSEEKARAAIAAGADGLAHLFVGDAARHDFGRFAAEHRVFVIPTLAVLAAFSGRPQGPTLLADPHRALSLPPEDRFRLKRPEADPSRGRWYQATREAMKQLIEARVPLLAGTDTGAGTTIAPNFVQSYGASLHGELHLLVEADMSPVQALTAATSAPARVFRLADRGLIRPGMRADLVLVEGDPTRNVLATRKVVAVWKQGVQFFHRRAIDA
jgi:imidazolonepropionase-like amidohydrolase